MKNTKRILSMLLAILMVLGVLPFAVFANDGAETEEPETGATEPKPYYTYYVQDGLTFLWSGEDYEIGEAEETVKALVNLLNPDEKLDKMMYGRQMYNLAKNDGNGNAIFNSMAYKKVNGGVIMMNDKALIYTDIVPTTMIGDVEVLTDMTFEVSQSHFDSVATSTSTTFSAVRGHDGGSLWYGPLGAIGNSKMPYKAVVVGTTMYFYGEYADTNGVATPFYFTSTPKTASNPKYTYQNGEMIKITDQAVLDLINEQANAKTLTVDGIAKELTAAGNNYASFLAIDAHGTSGVFQHNTAPFSSMNYDRAGQTQFLNNTVNQAFTSTIIFDYADVAASTKFDFAIGRDGMKYAAALTGKAYDATEDKSVGTYFTGTTGVHEGVTYTKNETFLGFVGDRDANYAVGTSNFSTMLAYAVADEGRNFAFTYGTNIATVLHAIRMYNRVLTDAELAQNHFVDIAMKLGADLSYYDTLLADETLKEFIPVAHAVASGLDEGDFTKESFEEAFKAAVEQAIVDAMTPDYADLYVQDGLTFLWTGEGNHIGGKTTVTNRLNSAESITRVTNGRMKTEYFPGKAAEFYSIENGVLLVSGNGKLILNDLIPTRTLSNGTKALSDMTIEFSQSYPDYYKTSANGSATLNVRGFDGGYNYFGPANASYVKTLTGAIKVGGVWYAPFTYTNPEDPTDVQTVYVSGDISSAENAPKTFSYYSYDAATGKLTELGQLTASVTEGVENTAAALSSPVFSKYGTSNSFAFLLPFDANNIGPIKSWGQKELYTICDEYGKPQFMNAKANEIYTTTITFDYGYAEGDFDSTTYSYAMGIGRDGAIIADTTFSGTYDATKDYSTADTDNDNSNFGFTYGVSTMAVNYYAIRIYDRVLTPAEIAQNNFVDIALQLDGDMIAYSEASQGTKDRIHMAFASYSAEDFTTESFNKTLAEMLEFKGFASVDGSMESTILTFDGFAGALEYYSGVRAVFEANQEILAQFEASGTKVEVGVLVSPSTDPNALTVSYDADGTPIASDGAVLRVAYETDGANRFLTDSTKFSLAVTNPENEITPYYDTEMCFRAYITLSDGTDSATFYCNAEGATFGDSVSFTKVYRYLYLNGYSEYESVKIYGAEIEELLDSVKNEMDALENDMAAINEKLAEIDALVEVHDEYYAKAKAKSDDAFSAYYYAYNAYAAAYAINSVNAELLALTPSVEEKIAALEAALAGAEPTDDSREMAAILTANFKKTLEDAKNYTNKLSAKGDLITDAIVEGYINTYLAKADMEANPNYLLNGKGIESYVLLAEEDELAAAEKVADAVLYNAGQLLFVTSDTFASLTGGMTRITLQNNADMDFGTYAITVDEDGNITLAGQGDNGAYHAAMKFASLLEGVTEATVTTTEGNYKEVMTQTYAAEGFLKADGTLDTEASGDLNVVFIGGSLTELGKSVWTTGVSNYLQSIFPNKKVNHINSGVGGTNSEGAAARFCEHVAPHNPDIIFIEFTVNDDMNNFQKDRAQYRMENFLYQCSQLDKIPTVVYLHTPPATLPGSGVYNEWYQQVEYKEEWAAHYGVETINIFDYSYGKWEKETENGTTTDDYITWLDQYYGTLQDEIVGNNGKYGRYDVHGGYQLYLEAVIEALEANAAEILAPYRFMPYMHPEKVAEIEKTYVVKPHDDEMFTYSEEGWDAYYEYDASIHKSGYLRIPTGRWAYPFLVSGVHQGSEGASFTFKTTANSMTIYYMAVLNDTNKTISDAALNYGGQFEISVGGVVVGTVGTASTYVQPFISSTIDLKNVNNEEIEVTVTVAKAKNAHEAFARFTSIWFGYNNDNPNK